MRWFLTALLLLLALAGEARAQAGDGRFCATLRRLLTAAAERPAFASLGQPGPTDAAAGLGLGACRIDAGLYGNRLVCLDVTNARHAAGQATERRIASCLPAALRMSEPDGSRLARFRLGTLAFHVERGRGTMRFSLFALPVERR